MASRLTPELARVELAARRTWRDLKKLRPRYQAALAVECAVRVLPVYEAFYQDNLARKALESARDWIERPGERRLDEAARHMRILRDGLGLDLAPDYPKPSEAIRQPALVAGMVILEAVVAVVYVPDVVPEDVTRRVAKSMHLATFVFGAAAYQEADPSTDRTRAFQAGRADEAEAQRRIVMLAVAAQSPGGRRGGSKEESDG